MHLNNIEISNDQNSGFSITDAVVTEIDGSTLLLTITEQQRVDALRTSGTRGGDGHHNYLHVGGGAFQDVGNNLNLESHAVVLDEIPDEISPVVQSARIRYGTGELTLYVGPSMNMIYEFE